MPDLSQIFGTFTDATVYFVMAAVGTSLFVLRLAFALFLGFDGDVDVDMDVGDADFDTGSTATFSMFSLLSILAFFMGAGWMGLAARLEWGLSSLPSALVSTGFGTAMMLLASGGMYLVKRASQTIVWDPRSCIGATGRVYLTIPADGEGQGQVEVTAAGRRKILPAVTRGEPIGAFLAVRVLEVRDDGVLVVEPAK